MSIIPFIPRRRKESVIKKKGLSQNAARDFFISLFACFPLHMFACAEGYPPHSHMYIQDAYNLICEKSCASFCNSPSSFLQCFTFTICSFFIDFYRSSSESSSAGSVVSGRSSSISSSSGFRRTAVVFCWSLRRESRSLRSAIIFSNASSSPAS